MKISRELLRKIAGRFIKILGSEKVRGLPDLEKLAGQAIPIDDCPDDYLLFEWRPSEFGTRALDVAYALNQQKDRKGGLPLVVKINPSLDYSRIILKCQEGIRGYEHFATDPFENLVQNKVIRTTDFWEITKELGLLQ